VGTGHDSYPDGIGAGQPAPSGGAPQQ
jgi:hypothetical protein